MSIGAFTDKSSPPTREQVLQTLGPARDTWEALEQFIQEHYPGQAGFRFYGKNYGWALRFRKGGKALLSLYPAQDGFTVQIVVGEAEIQQALERGLGRQARQAIEKATPYAEGRWLYIPVKSRRDLKDVRQLLDIKFGQSRQRA